MDTVLINQTLGWKSKLIPGACLDNRASGFSFPLFLTDGFDFCTLLFNLIKSDK